MANVEENASAAVGVNDLDPPFALGHKEAVVAGVGDGRDLVEPARQRRGAESGLAGGQGDEGAVGRVGCGSCGSCGNWGQTSSSAARAVGRWRVGWGWRIGWLIPECDGD